MKTVYFPAWMCVWFDHDWQDSTIMVDKQFCMRCGAQRDKP